MRKRVTVWFVSLDKDSTMTLRLLLILFSGITIAHAQSRTIEFKDKTLYDLEALSPNECDGPWNFPYFIDYREIPNIRFSGYMHIDSVEMFPSGRLRADFFTDEDHEGLMRYRMRINYGPYGQMEGLSSYEVSASDGEGGFEIMELIEVWYEDNVQTKARYTNFKHDHPIDGYEKLVIEEADPIRVSLSYFKILKSVLQKENNHPTLSLGAAED